MSYSDGDSVSGKRSDGEVLCVDVAALQRLSWSLHADADVLAAVDITASTDRTAAALPGSATAKAVLALAHPIHVAHDRIGSRLHEIADAIEYHVRACVEADLTAGQR